MFVLDTNRIFPSLAQFPVCAPYGRTSCDVICNVIGHFGLRDSVFRLLLQGSKTKQKNKTKNKQTKKMFLFYSFTNSFSHVKIVYSMEYTLFASTVFRYNKLQTGPELHVTPMKLMMWKDT